MHPSLMEMLAHARREHEEDRLKVAIDIEAVKLVDALRSLQTEHTFKVGDLVRQKPDAKMYKGFGDNDLAIVVELLAEPLIVEKESAGHSFFRNRVDMLIGSIEEGRIFAVYHVDSRRFEPVTDPDVRRLLNGQGEP